MYISNFGNQTEVKDGYRRVYLPISFTNTNYYVNASSTNSTNYSRVFHCGIQDKIISSFLLNCRGTSSGGDYSYTDGVTIFAIGY